MDPANQSGWYLDSQANRTWLGNDFLQYVRRHPDTILQFSNPDIIRAWTNVAPFFPIPQLHPNHPMAVITFVQSPFTHAVDSPPQVLQLNQSLIPSTTLLPNLQTLTQTLTAETLTTPPMDPYSQFLTLDQAPLPFVYRAGCNRVDVVTTPVNLQTLHVCCHFEKPPGEVELQHHLSLSVEQKTMEPLELGEGWISSE